MYTLEPIGTIHSCFQEKFGIPRQPGLVPAASATIELFPPYDREEMFRGLEEFSHIWVLFLFHESVLEGWRATVRPPRLGGRQRVGLYASRSPHRPNHLGMSVVKMERVVESSGGVFLEISGIDLLEGTPVVDLKPYVPYTDMIDGASCGFTRELFPEVAVRFAPAAAQFCAEYRRETGRDLQTLIEQTLRVDPRPASQKTGRREFGVLLWDVNVRWRIGGRGFEVVSCERAAARRLKG